MGQRGRCGTSDEFADDDERHARRCDPRDGRLHEPRAGARTGRRRALGHLGIRRRPVRDADGQIGIWGRHGGRGAEQCAEDRSGLDRAARLDAARRFDRSSGAVCRRIRASVFAISRMHDFRSKKRSTSQRLRLLLAAPVPARKGRERLLWAAALAVAVVATAAGTVLSIRRPRVEPSEVRLELNTPPTTDPASLAISPDGRQIVFAATSEEKSRLWVRALDGASGTRAGRNRRRIASVLVPRQSIGRVLRRWTAQAHRPRQRICPGIDRCARTVAAPGIRRARSSSVAIRIVPSCASPPTAESRPT